MVLEINEPEGLQLCGLEDYGESLAPGRRRELPRSGPVAYVDGGGTSSLPPPASPSSVHHVLFCDYAQYLYVCVIMHIMDSCIDTKSGEIDGI